MTTPSKQQHEDLGEARLITQWKDSTVVKGLLKSWLQEAQTIEDLLFDLLEKRGIDTAEGVNLDIIGAIVGQPREIVDAADTTYFGFDGDPQASSFGTLTNPTIGGRFASVGEQTTGIRTLDDDEYRIYIKSKIFRDSAAPTVENIVQQIKTVFDVDVVILTEQNPASYELYIGKELSIGDKLILRDTDVIPKTAGVTVTYVAGFDSDSYFGFAGSPSVKGFGSTTDPSVGGGLGSLLY